MLSFAVAKLLRLRRVEDSLGLRPCTTVMEEKWASKIRILGEFMLANTELQITAKYVGLSFAYITGGEGMWMTRHIYPEIAQKCAQDWLMLPLFGFFVFRTYRAAKMDHCELLPQNGQTLFFKKDESYKRICDVTDLCRQPKTTNNQ